MREKVPRLVVGVDVRQFKLDPMDGFLMTRIDGTAGALQLARETGLPDFSVARALEKLERLGIIELVDPNAPPTPQAAPPPPAPPEPRSALGQFDGGLLAPKYDPSELEAPADLTIEQKKRILDLYYRLDDLDHYTLLGTRRDADKKGVKRAYFELAATFHPDRYFKKDLGDFKPKMEILFDRITEAHDTLVDKEKRAEYDSYLAEVATTHGMEAMLERAMAESARAGARSPGASAAPPSDPAHGASASVGGSAAQPPAPAPSPPPPPAAPSPEEIRRRKQALADRLMGGQRAPKPPPVAAASDAAPNPLRYENPADAVDALRRRYTERLGSATQAQVLKYVQSAESEQAKGNVIAASTALEMAVKLAPDDATIAARAKEAQVAANRALCESYLKQAESDEGDKRWAEAARSWIKIARIQNDANAHGKAAQALVRSPDGDLHLAAEHAKRAIAAEPSAIDNHVTLVEIYVKAGLSVSARKAAEVATALDPNHAGLQALLKRIGKG